MHAIKEKIQINPKNNPKKGKKNNQIEIRDLNRPRLCTRRTRGEKGCR